MKFLSEDYLKNLIFCHGRLMESHLLSTGVKCFFEDGYVCQVPYFVNNVGEKYWELFPNEI
jgi:hypothetical protein